MSMIKQMATLAAAMSALASNGSVIEVSLVEGDATPAVQAAVARLHDGGTLRFAPGEYHFFEEGAKEVFLASVGSSTGMKKVVLDLHVPPGGYDASHEANMFHDARFADHFVELWRRIARRFRGREGIYGYDLVNEPLQAREAAPGCDFLTLMRRAAEAVRAEDPAMPIIVESNHCGSPAFFAELEPLPFVNVIYQLHFYWPWEFTHQRVLNYRMWTVVWPDESHGWNRGAIDWSLKPVIDFQQKYGARIYAGEFSAVAWAPGAENYLRDCISVFEEHGWDWSYHAFREWAGWSVEHEGEDDASLRPSAGNPRKRALLDGLKGN